MSHWHLVEAQVGWRECGLFQLGFRPVFVGEVGSLLPRNELLGRLDAEKCGVLVGHKTYGQAANSKLLVSNHFILLPGDRCLFLTRRYNNDVRSIILAHTRLKLTQTDLVAGAYVQLSRAKHRIYTY